MKNFTTIELSAKDTHHARDVLKKLAGEYCADSENDCAAERTKFVADVLGEEASRQLGFIQYPEDFLLSVVIPVFNEATTIEKVIDRVRAVGIPCELIVIDDGSTDGTRDVLKEMEGQDDLTIVLHEENQGKGAAITTGLSHVQGQAVVIQDADMEYDPRDFRLLLAPILDDQADVVYGSRFSRSQFVSPVWHQTGNQIITWLSNLANGLKLTDVETCYKMFRRDIIDQIAPTLREKRFGIEIEMTAKLAKLKDIRFHERPISYDKRTYAEGKKIGLRDGFRAVWCMLRY